MPIKSLHRFYFAMLNDVILKRKVAPKELDYRFSLIIDLIIDLIFPDFGKKVRTEQSFSLGSHK